MNEVDALKAEFAELKKSLESNNDVIAKQVEAVSAPAAVSEDVLLKMDNIHELSWSEVEQLAKEVRNL